MKRQSIAARIADEDVSVVIRIWLICRTGRVSNDSQINDPLLGESPKSGSLSDHALMSPAQHIAQSS